MVVVFIIFFYKSELIMFTILISNLIFVPVQLHCSCMSKELIMRDDIWFYSRVPATRFLFLKIERFLRSTATGWKEIFYIIFPLSASTWCKGTQYITSITKTPRLIQRDPVFHTITKFFETKLSVVCEIIPMKLFKSFR